MERVLAGIAYAMLCHLAVAQFDYHNQFTYPDFEGGLANTLLFRIEDNGFVKNNEYYSDYLEGCTLLGHDVEASFLYYAGEKVRLKVGVHVQKYSGIESFSQVLPIVSLHTKLTPGIDLIMGTLRGGVHHQLNEAIFDSERRYTHPVESGIQLLWTSPGFGSMRGSIGNILSSKDLMCRRGFWPDSIAAPRF